MEKPQWTTIAASNPAGQKEERAREEKVLNPAHDNKECR
jgi:hypothetical protein